jgi:hypothetical protein
VTLVLKYIVEQRVKAAQHQAIDSSDRSQ